MPWRCHPKPPRSRSTTWDASFATRCRKRAIARAKAWREERAASMLSLGGGTFGSVVAEHLFITDATRSRRILVLEAGPFALPEHAQNMPFMGGAPDMRVPWANHS